MTLPVVPAWSEPTVTTAASSAAISRETIVWRRRTVAAAMTTGSTLDSGIEPWAPRPKSRTSRPSAAACVVPGRYPIVPAGPGMTCWPRMTCGLGKR